jgi:hypothetical protein
LAHGVLDFQIRWNPVGYSHIFSLIGFKWARRKAPLYDDTIGLVGISISMVYIEVENVMEAML